MVTFYNKFHALTADTIFLLTRTTKTLASRFRVRVSVIRVAPIEVLLPYINDAHASWHNEPRDESADPRGHFIKRRYREAVNRKTVTPSNPFNDSYRSSTPLQNPTRSSLQCLYYWLYTRTHFVWSLQSSILVFRIWLSNLLNIKYRILSIFRKGEG